MKSAVGTGGRSFILRALVDFSNQRLRGASSLTSGREDAPGGQEARRGVLMAALCLAEHTAGNLCRAAVWGSALVSQRPCWFFLLSVLVLEGHHAFSFANRRENCIVWCYVSLHGMSFPLLCVSIKPSVHRKHFPDCSSTQDHQTRKVSSALPPFDSSHTQPQGVFDGMLNVLLFLLSYIYL